MVNKHHLWMQMGRSRLGCRIIRSYLATVGGDAHFVSSATQLVVEGYPRSANTQVVAALREANGEALMLAHHYHASWQFVRAAELKIPALLLIRNPVDAIASLMIRDQTIEPARAFADYIAFHTQAKTVIHSLIVATFDQAIGELDRVIAKVNEKFSSQISMPYSKPGEVERVLIRVDEMDREDRRRGTVNDLSVARPSAKRAAITDGIKAKLELVTPPPLLDQALTIYSEFKSFANRDS